MTPIPVLSPSSYAARLLACSLLWSSGFLFMKLAGSVHPVVIAASRATIATLVLSAWYVAQGRSPLPTRDEIRPWLVLGTLNGWIPNILTAYALIHISAALSAAFTAAGTFGLASTSLDAAMVATLSPGNHTVVVTPVPGTATGTGLVEVYELP